MKNDFKSVVLPLRLMAEELLKSKQSSTNQKISKTEIQNMIHELQVHQIELELQNEELLLAKEESELAKLKYTELFDFAPLGYLILSDNGDILELNLMASQMLEKERYKLRFSRFGFFVSDKTRPNLMLFLSRIFSSKTSQSCELELSSDDNQPSIIQLNGIISDNEEQCLVAMIDVTEQKRSEEFIRNSENRYRLLLDLAADAFFHEDKNGDFITVNSSAIAQTGFSRDELMQMNIKDLFSEEMLISPTLRYDQLKRGEIVHSERTVIRKDGTPITVEMNSRMMPDGTFQSFFRDVTERNRIDKALKRKVSELEIYYELAITRERKMIALKGEINLLLERFGEKPKY